MKEIKVEVEKDLPTQNLQIATENLLEPIKTPLQNWQIYDGAIPITLRPEDLGRKEIVEELKKILNEKNVEIYLNENGILYNLRRCFLYNEKELPDELAEKLLKSPLFEYVERMWKEYKLEKSIEEELEEAHSQAFITSPFNKERVLEKVIDHFKKIGRLNELKEHVREKAKLPKYQLMEEFVCELWNGSKAKLPFYEILEQYGITLDPANFLRLNGKDVFFLDNEKIFLRKDKKVEGKKVLETIKKLKKELSYPEEVHQLPSCVDEKNGWFNHEKGRWIHLKDFVEANEAAHDFGNFWKNIDKPIKESEDPFIQALIHLEELPEYENLTDLLKILGTLKTFRQAKSKSSDCIDTEFLGYNFEKDLPSLTSLSSEEKEMIDKVRGRLAEHLLSYFKNYGKAKGLIFKSSDFSRFVYDLLSSSQNKDLIEEAIELAASKLEGKERKEFLRMAYAEEKNKRKKKTLIGWSILGFIALLLFLNLDFDFDGIRNLDEITTHKTNIFKKDTDGDGFTDYEEAIRYRFNPNNPQEQIFLPIKSDFLTLSQISKLKDYENGTSTILSQQSKQNFKDIVNGLQGEERELFFKNIVADAFLKLSSEQTLEGVELYRKCIQTHGKYNPTDDLTVVDIIAGKVWLYSNETRHHLGVNDPWRWSIISDSNGFEALPNFPRPAYQWAGFEMKKDPEMVKHLNALLDGKLNETNLYYSLTSIERQKLIDRFDFFWKHVPKELEDSPYVIFTCQPFVVFNQFGVSQFPLLEGPYRAFTVENRSAPSGSPWIGIGLNKAYEVYKEIESIEPDALIKEQGVTDFVRKHYNWEVSGCEHATDFLTKIYESNGCPIITYHIVFLRNENKEMDRHVGSLVKLQNKLIWSTDIIGGNSSWPYWIDIDKTKKIFIFSTKNWTLKRLYVGIAARERKPFETLYEEQI